MALLATLSISCEKLSGDLAPGGVADGGYATLYASYDGVEGSRVDGNLWESGDFIGVKTSDVEDDDNICFAVEPNGLMSNTDEESDGIFATESKDYYAYYPYNSTLESGNTLSIDLSKQGSQSLSTLDLMWAKQEGAGLYQPTIYLLFSRQLVHLNITLCIKDGSFDRSRGIVLKGVSLGGSFDITTGELTTSDLRENLTLEPLSVDEKSLADGTIITTVRAEALVMPMEGKSLSFIFYNSAGESVIWSTTPTWAKGSNYNYTVCNGCKSYSLDSISSSDIADGDLVVIDDWNATSEASFDALNLALSGKSDVTLHLANLTALPSYTFAGCTGIGSISMPAMKMVGNNAFENCSSLKSVYADQLEYVAGNSFARCSALSSITMPNLYVAGDYAFMGTGLTSFSSDDLINIGTYAFSESPDMTSFHAPALAWVGSCAFSSCSSLTTLSIGESSEGITNLEYGWIDPTYCSRIDLTISPIMPSGILVDGNILRYQDGSEYIFKSITNESLMLSSFDGSLDLSTLPSDEWTIMDSSVSSADDFAGLREALAGLSNSVSLTFPNLTNLPQGALSNVSGFNAINLMSISGIEASVLDGCGALSRVVLGRAGSIISSIDSGWIGDVASEDVELTISGTLSPSMSYEGNKFIYSDGAESRFRTIDGVGYYLSEFDADLMQSPPRSVEWVISDREAKDSDAFSDLRGVLSRIGSQAGVSLIFSELGELPRYALSESSSISKVTLSKATRVYYGALSMIESLEEVYMPKVTTLSDNIFASDIFAAKHQLRVVDIPSAMVIGSGLFQFAISMESINLGSVADNIVSLDSGCFSSFPTEGVDLTINKSRPEGVTVSGDTLTIIGEDGMRYSYTFESITEI